MRPLAFCLVTFCTLQRISCDSTTNDDPLLVYTEQGPVRGVMMDSAIDGEEPFMAFKGIPYAEAPIGDLRFKAPVKAKSWDGERDATEFGKDCLQYNSLSKNVTGYEDCLFINVFTPDTTSSNSPVVVHISSFAHEFDFEKSMYGADLFMLYNVVLVTFNYRLGPLGFLNLETEDVPGNAGMKDQVLALKWVQDNVDKFGGDPKNVTLIGTSSGSASVAHHMASEMSKGLFKSAIMISGVPSCDPVFPFKVVEKSYLFAKSGGCENNCELSSCLQNIEINEEMLKNEWQLLALEFNNIEWKKMAQFVPVPEKDFGQERFMDDSSIKKFLYRNISNEVDVMVGYASHESMFFIKEFVEDIIPMYNEYPELTVPNKIAYNVTSYTILDTAKKIIDFYFGNETICVENLKQFIDMTSLASLVHDMGRLTDKFSPYLNTYVFKFSCQSNRNYFGLQGKQYGIDGTSHADSLYYMFNPEESNWILETDTEEYKLCKQFMDPIINFVKTGNPTPDNSWPLYTPDSQNYMEFSDTMKVQINPEKEQCDFWNGIYEDTNYRI